MTKNYKPNMFVETLNELKVKSVGQLSAFLLIVIFLFSGQIMKAQISYTTPGANYFQTFDSLYTSGSVPANNTTVAASTLPSGWLFTEAGSSANITLRNDNGSSGTGDTYLDGPTGINERAFGGASSGSLTTQFGAYITNNTGGTLTQFTLTYRGEQWRDGGSTTAIFNTDSFAYSINPSSLTVGTYTRVPALDFRALVNNTTADATLDGNSGANRRLITATVTGISWPNGQNLYIRWTDLNDAGNDDNLAIDSVVFSASTSSTPTVAIASSHPAAIGINQGSADNIIGAISLAVTLNTATLNSVAVKTAGSYSTSSDFTNFKFWLSSSASSISGATQLGSTLSSVTSGSTLSVSGLSNTISAGTTRYILVTSSVSATGTVGSTVRIDTTNFSTITFASANKTGTDPVPAGNYDTIVAVPPSIALSDASPAAGTINQSSTNNILRSVQMNVTAAAATLNEVKVNTGGTYLTSDLPSNSFKIWYNTSNNLSGATQLGTNRPIVSSGDTIRVTGLSQTVPLGTSYILITTDVAYDANPSRYINIASTSFANLIFASGDKTGTDPVVAGNNQTFGALTPSIAIAQLDTNTANISPGAINRSIYQLSLAVTTNSTNLNSLAVTTAGTYQTTDLVADSVKLYFNTTNSLATATRISNIAVVSSGGTLTFSGLNQFIALGTTGYVWVTTDLASTAVSGRTINVTSTPFTNITFSSGTKTGTDPARVGGVKTIVPLLVQQYFTPVFIPQVMSSGSSTRLPFMFRATVTNLTPNTTYRYYTNAATNSTAGGGTVDFGTTNSGAGNPLMIDPTGATYSYSTSVSLTAAGNYSTFVTNASGNYTGWFGLVNTGNARFTGGNYVYPSIVIGDSVGNLLEKRGMSDSIKVLTYSASAGANNGSFLKEASSSALGKNFVLIYDNVAGTGKPIYIAPIENIGLTIASVISGYTTSAGGWNAIIPNNNANGIRRIEQRDFNGNIICYATDADGVWTTGSINTVNPTSGTTAITISSTDASLTPPAITAQPLATQTVCQSRAPSNLVVTASGSGLSFQWYKNMVSSTAGATSIGGATAASYTPSTDTAGVRYYYCVVTKFCDSMTNIVSVDVLANSTGTFSQSICSGTSYLFNGVNLTTAGSYLDTLSNSVGCDSFVTLNLTVRPTSSGSLSANICNNDYYTFNGVNLNVAGTYLDTFSNYVGCDSVVTLTLAVRSISTGTISASICTGASFFFDGANRTSTGLYYDTLVNAVGCDSVLTLNLTVLTSCSLPPNDSRCRPINFSASGVFNENAIWNLGTTNPDCDTLFGNTIGATAEAGEPFGSAAGSGGSQRTTWFVVNAPTCAASSVRFSTNTSPTDYNTRLTAYHRVTPSACAGAYTELASTNDDGFSPISNASTVTLTPGSGAASSSTFAPGAPIYVQISGYSGDAGNYGVIVDVDAPDLTLGAVSASSIAVNFPSAALSYGTVSSIYLRYRRVGDVATSYAQVTLPSSTTTYTIAGLASGETYDVWAMYRCSAEDRWVTRKVTSGTTPGCGTPAFGPTVDTVGACNAVVVSWTPTPLATRYNLYWKRVGQIGYNIRYVYAPATSSVITGLLNGTNYQFWIQSICTGGAYATSPITPFVTCGVSARMMDPSGDVATEEGMYQYDNLSFSQLPITTISSMISANYPSVKEVELSSINLLNESSSTTATPIEVTDFLTIYPNPATTEATINYSLPTESAVMTIKVYDVQGKVMLNETINEPAATGAYTIQLNNYTGGIYFVKVEANNFNETRKLVVDQN